MIKKILLTTVLLLTFLCGVAPAEEDNSYKIGNPEFIQIFSSPISEDKKTRITFVNDWFYENGNTLFTYIYHQFYEVKGLRFVVGAGLSQNFPNKDLGGLAAMQVSGTHFDVYHFTEVDFTLSQNWDPNFVVTHLAQLQHQKKLWKPLNIGYIFIATKSSAQIAPELSFTFGNVTIGAQYTFGLASHWPTLVLRAWF